MPKYIAAFLILGLVSNLSIAAADGENQANSFANIYASLCLKHLNNLDVLREMLKPMPKLPSEKTAYFLAGNDGDAWPVPDKYGTFVLALPAGKNLCAVYARRADTVTAEKLFLNLVANAPSPLVSKQVKNDHAQTAANGTTHTIAYEWSIPNARRKMLFILTTTPSESSQLQVLGTASIISR